MRHITATGIMEIQKAIVKAKANCTINLPITHRENLFFRKGREYGIIDIQDYIAQNLEKLNPRFNRKKFDDGCKVKN